MSHYGRGPGPRYGPDRPDPRSGLPNPSAPVDRPPLPTPAEVLRDLDNIGAVARQGRYGSKGKKIDVKANCFPADISGVTRIVTHYDITYEKIIPEPEGGGRGGRGGRGRGRGRRGGRGGRGGGRGGQTPDERPVPLGICTKLIRQIESNYARDFKDAKIAHDGRKNAYTAIKPDWEMRDFEATLEDTKYKVNFKVVNDVNMDDLANYTQGHLSKIPQECVTVLDIVLRTSPLREWVYTGRAFGVPPVGEQIETYRIGEGCEAWICYYQAFRPNENGMFLTFDVMYSAFYAEQSLYDYAVDLFSGSGRAQEEGGQAAFQRPLEHSQVRRLLMELQGLRVSKNYGTEEDKRKKFTVKSLTNEPAAQVEYETGDNRRMTIQEHFENIGEALLHPHMPCVKVPQGKNATAYVPLEKCQIDHGQQRSKPMNRDMKERLSKIAVQNPLSRMGRIGDVLGDVNASTQEYLNAFGVKVDLQKLAVPARILEPPAIQLGKGRILDVEAANESNEYSYNMDGKQFYQSGTPLKSWGVLVLADITKYDVQRFVAGVQVILREMGVESENPTYSYSYTPILQKGMNELFAKINNTPGASPCQLIMVIKTNDASRDYNRIKNIGDTFLGIPTQCVVASHARTPRKLYIRNLALKINAKLGGITARIDGVRHFALLGQRCMVVGATVSHASGYEVIGDMPSIATMVGSLDKRCGRYFGTWRVQGSKVSVIDEFGDMFAELLRNFYDREAAFPDNVLIYRNGVADGQFVEVIRQEMNAARSSAKSAGQEVGEDYNPKITFVVMQRGHHMRFVPADEGPKDKSENCLPGTVIDSLVSHPRNYDFYLISHNGIQGVSRPQRYTVLVDDIGFTPDQIQGFTYDLCYTYIRCTRSVSIVPPVYYANLLATRVQNYQAARSPGRLELVFDQPIVSKDWPLPKEYAEGNPVMHRKLSNLFFYV